MSSADAKLSSFGLSVDGLDDVSEEDALNEVELPMQCAQLAGPEVTVAPLTTSSLSWKLKWSTRNEFSRTPTFWTMKAYYSGWLEGKSDDAGSRVL